jgi:protein gp37
MITKTKIEWCDWTWNPVWGCENSCLYCYARKIAKRFGKKISEKQTIDDFKNNREKSVYTEDLFNFKPTWIESNFIKQFPKKPSRIFVNSMSDISYWKPEWINKVINKIKEYPHHQFLFLTKNPDIYNQYEFTNNCWLGTTIINQFQMNAFANSIFDDGYTDKHKVFVSIEPIQEEIKMYVNFDWVIIGRETGNRKDKITPKTEWIENIKKTCEKDKIPYFEKNSLKIIVNRDLIQEFPI